MTESVYKIIEVVGTSAETWEQAARNAVERAAESLEDIRVGEVTQLDMKVNENRVVAYRAKVKVSFKFRPNN